MIQQMAQAIHDAGTFLAKLQEQSIPWPYVSIADDGEVNFLWQTPSLHVDLGFYGTGTYSCYAKVHPIDTIAMAEEYFLDDMTLDAPLPESVVARLKHGSVAER